MSPSEQAKLIGMALVAAVLGAAVWDIHALWRTVRRLQDDDEKAQRRIGALESRLDAMNDRKEPPVGGGGAS